jgi:hypothetical protein
MTISDFLSSNMANFAHFFQKNTLYIVTTMQNFAKKKTFFALQTVFAVPDHLRHQLELIRELTAPNSTR